MSDNTETNSNGGIGVTTVLTLIFVVLKLTGSIDWGWFWVLFPSIVGVSLGIIALIIAFILYLRS